MKAIIIYFSQTGNTKKIGQAICKGIAETFESVDFVSVASLKDASLLKEYDLVGFGCPVWSMKEPGIMTRFFDKINKVDKQPAFLFCTHATLTGGFFKRVVPLLTDKGFVVLGFEDWFGQKVNPTVESPYYTDGHPDDIDLYEAKCFGKRVCRRFETGDDLPLLPKGDNYDVRYGSLEFLKQKLTQNTKLAAHRPAEFVFEADKCQHCDLCKSLCPAQAIDPESQPVLNKTLCERCHFCELICPGGAISFKGKLKIDPESPTNKLIMEDLMKYRCLRRFRPLIDLKRVATIKPSEERLNRHPYLTVKEDIGVWPDENVSDIK